MHDSWAETSPQFHSPTHPILYSGGLLSQGSPIGWILLFLTIYFPLRLCPLPMHSSLREMRSILGSRGHLRGFSLGCWEGRNILPHLGMKEAQLCLETLKRCRKQIGRGCWVRKYLGVAFVPRHWSLFHQHGDEKTSSVLVMWQNPHTEIRKH